MNKPTKLNVIIIDPLMSIIHQKTIDNNLDGLRGAIDDHNIELVRIDDDNDMFCDEEGLFRENQSYFIIKGKERIIPIAGKCVVLGNTPDGDSSDVKMSVTDLAKMIEFKTRTEMYYLSKEGKI